MSRNDPQISLQKNPEKTAITQAEMQQQQQDEIKNRILRKTLSQVISPIQEPPHILQPETSIWKDSFKASSIIISAPLYLGLYMVSLAVYQYGFRLMK